MSNEVDIFQQGSTAVSTASRRDDGFTNNITASSTTAKRISIRGGLFRLMVNGKELDHTDQRHMDVVIVNASPAVHRTFYAGNYNATQKAPPPVCWSSDSVSPDATVPEPQAKDCASCPQNIKGSGANGSKACRFSRRIAVVQADQDANGAFHLKDDVFQVTLPAQSIFGNGTTDKRPLHEYTDYVKANGESLMSVITRMAFDTNSATPRLGFRAVGRISDEQFDRCRGISQSDEAKRAVTLTVATNREEGENNASLADQFAAPPPNASRPAAPAQPATQPLPPVQNVEPIQADAIPEPTVRSASAPAPVAPAKVDLGDVSLDDLVGDWA